MSIPRAIPFALACCLLVGLTGASLADVGELVTQGASWLAAGDLARARQAFERAAETDSLCAVAPVGVGATELFSRRPAAAEDAFARGLALCPALPCAHIGMGTAQCTLGDYKGALESYHAALVGQPRRPATALAGEAYAACALGLYDQASQQARAALGTDPTQPVARYAYAAAALAKGEPRIAADLDRPESGCVAVANAPVCLSSCLLAPGTAYWDQRQLGRGEELAGLPRLASATAPAPEGVLSRSTPEFKLTRPREGEAVTGPLVVEVACEASLQLDYVVIFVNNTFAGHSAVRPYRFTVDTRLHPDGLTEVRAEGCNAQGALLCSASTVVRVQNGNRTIAPDERAAVAAGAELLESMLLPPLAPMATEQLAGQALQQLGQPERAAAAFEGAYAHNAGLPALRAGLLQAYQALGLHPQAAADEIRALPSRPRNVALTFDDGPHPLITPWILDQLDREHIKATFFLVGKQATLYPELVREILQRGHTIGTHSYSHYSFRSLSAQEVEQDLVKSRLAIREACGLTVTLFRPPGGYCDATVRAAAGALGLTICFWTCNITSFPGADGIRIAGALSKQAADGGIILLHNGEDETLDTLPHLIPELKRLGLGFVTLPGGHVSDAPAGDARRWGR